MGQTCYSAPGMARGLVVPNCSPPGNGFLSEDVAQERPAVWTPSSHADAGRVPGADDGLCRQPAAVGDGRVRPDFQEDPAAVCDPVAAPSTRNPNPGTARRGPHPERNARLAAKSSSLHGPSFNDGPDAMFGCSPVSVPAAQTLSLDELVMDLSLSGPEDLASGQSSPRPC
jgi:hypothetical protein